jgi:hypothetical protein
MTTLILQHKIRDYAAWRPVFDAHEPARVKATVTNPVVYRGADDPNDIVMVFKIGDPKAAKSFFAGDDARDTMKRAGVIGTPVSHMTND